MRDVLVITDAFAPLAAGETGGAAAGLSRALAAGGHPTTVLTLCSTAVATDAAAHGLPGLARRLSPVRATVAGHEVEMPLFEGRAALSQARILVLASDEAGRGPTTALLGGAVESLAKDGMINPDVTIGWGETAAVALAGTAATQRLFVLPSGRLGPLLDQQEAAALGTVSYGDDTAGRSLAALGAASANAIVAPSASAARALEGNPGLASRAADEPLLALRFGCDDPPHDPASDPALPAHYSAAVPGGKAVCRRALARRASLALGPRTLLLATPRLAREDGAELLLATLSRLAGLDVVVVVPGIGEREAVDRARVLAIEHPGRVAVLAGEDPGGDRVVRAAADAFLVADADDRTGRMPGLALQYGTLPIAPNAGAASDYLVDFDPGSATGTAILYDERSAFAMESAIRRAIALRGDADAWGPLTAALMASAPTWAATAARLATFS